MLLNIPTIQVENINKIAIILETIRAARKRMLNKILQFEKKILRELNFHQRGGALKGMGVAGQANISISSHTILAKLLKQ